ncbi:MAG: hypothetical protein IJZ05_06245 [Rikenellaceae bacterium]|nr:hypothetical protein [Rikenellaceae bacterium]
MKKLFISICVVMFVFVAQAQEHMTFKGISMDCDIDTFVAKLENGGLLKSDANKYQFATLLTGHFAGEDNCNIYVAYTPQSKLVCKIIVQFPRKTSWSLLKDQYNRLKIAYTVKYGEPQSFEYFKYPYHEGDGKELEAVQLDECTYCSYYNTPAGIISIEIFNDHIRAVYEDNINFEKKQIEDATIILNDI